MMTQGDNKKSTRQLVHTTNNAYDMVLLVEGGKVVGAWEMDDAVAQNFRNPGDLNDWAETYPDEESVEDYGAVVAIKTN